MLRTWVCMKYKHFVFISLSFPPPSTHDTCTYNPFICRLPTRQNEQQREPGQRRQQKRRRKPRPRTLPENRYFPSTDRGRSIPLASQHAGCKPICCTDRCQACQGICHQLPVSWAGRSIPGEETGRKRVRDVECCFFPGLCFSRSSLHAILTKAT